MSEGQRAAMDRFQKEEGQGQSGEWIPAVRLEAGRPMRRLGERRWRPRLRQMCGVGGAEREVGDGK